MTSNAPPRSDAGTQTLKVAVDVSLLSGTPAGLSRYLSALLPRMIELAEGRVQWLLYGRHHRAVAQLLEHSEVKQRSDGLPPDLGRLLSLLLSMPLWSQIDRPAVFWGPAHRLPLRLPAATASVLTVHDLAWLYSPSTMRGATRLLDQHLMLRAARRSHSVICVSQASADALAKQVPEARQRIHVIPGAAEELPASRRDELMPGLLDAPFFLFVGTLEPRKNLPRLLRAYASAKRAANNLPRLVVAGAQGWGRTELAEEINRLGLQDQVILAGRVSDATLAALYADATTLIMPSLYEGFGLPIVEALSQGLPILTSDRASMPEVAGDAALLVDPESEDAIAAALGRLGSDHHLRQQLSAKAKQQAQRFCWDQAAAHTLEVLLKAVDPVSRATSEP